ncbi:hypothetical protein GW17_00038694 [Ensete ventricosum]|uniref:Uncharacterized protein n=1 Tax=Ensete ventricosum TaxID=4639 RepID=A0A444DK04_ENSVE|nr:hypothetical protein GW17_00038694 [Ensete ventricosum]RZR73769.1 hypothetical protein BHM03_00028029 [Ensete ventricosum]
MIGAAGELDYFSTHIRLRETSKSEDKAEGGTSVESSIPCSNGWRALVVKGAKEVENGEANFKYQDKAKRQRKRNFIRPFYYSTTAAESSWEPIGMLQLEQKIEDSAKG